MSSVPFPRCTSKSRIATRSSPCRSSACAAPTATLLKKQNPIARLRSAWWPGGRTLQNARRARPDMHEVHRKHVRARGPQRGLEGIRAHRGVGIELLEPGGGRLRRGCARRIRRDGRGRAGRPSPWAPRSARASRTGRARGVPPRSRRHAPAARDGPAPSGAGGRPRCEMNATGGRIARICFG